MTSNTNALAASTKRQYFEIHKRLLRQSGCHFGNEASGSPPPQNIVDFLIQMKPMISKRTWMLYRSAVLSCLSTELESFLYPDEREDLQIAIARLRSEKQTGARSSGSATSALKSNSLSTADQTTFFQSLLTKFKAGDQRALQLAAFGMASIATGLRPSEWEHAMLDRTVGDGLVLRVRNAKATHGRANGISRTLRLDEVCPRDKQAIETMIKIVAHVSTLPGGYPRWQSNLRHYLKRVAKQVFGPQARYPSLYTFRHQFAANSKAMLSQIEVAALMGHGSSATAGRNYARAKRANGAVGVRPIESEVAMVRIPSNTRHPLRRPMNPDAESMNGTHPDSPR